MAPGQALSGIECEENGKMREKSEGKKGSHPRFFLSVYCSLEVVAFLPQSDVSLKRIEKCIYLFFGRNIHKTGGIN